MTEHPFHPVANIFPLMGEAELDALAEDICTNGQRELIWRHRDGRIVDGRNRWLACRKLGIEPRTRTFGGEDAELVRFVVSLNLHRRHLSTSQRAIIFQRLEELEHGGNRQDAKLHLDRDEVARLGKVSKRSLADAKVVNGRGAPELIKAVEQGRMPVSQAANTGQ
jgi:ParB-like chromosome segregation protein Spo0J